MFNNLLDFGRSMQFAQFRPATKGYAFPSWLGPHGPRIGWASAFRTAEGL